MSTEDMWYRILLIVTDKIRPHFQCILDSRSIIIVSFHFRFQHTATECFFVKVFLRQEVSLHRHDYSILTCLVSFFQFFVCHCNRFVSLFIQNETPLSNHPQHIYYLLLPFSFHSRTKLSLSCKIQFCCRSHYLICLFLSNLFPSVQKEYPHIVHPYQY